MSQRRLPVRVAHGGGGAAAGAEVGAVGKVRVGRRFDGPGTPSGLPSAYCGLTKVDYASEPRGRRIAARRGGGCQNDWTGGSWRRGGSTGHVAAARKESGGGCGGLEVNRTSEMREQPALAADGQRNSRGAARHTRPARLNANERKRLITALMAGAVAHGYRGDLWTLRRVGKLIETLTGQQYAESSVSCLLERLGILIQRPNGRGPRPGEPAARRGRTKRRPALEREFEVAVNSGAIDLMGYSTVTGGEFSSATDAFEHYSAAGRAAHPELFPFLDHAHYARQLDTELPRSMTVFEHYITEGAQRCLSPTPLFDLSFVRSQAPELRIQTIFDYLGTPGFAMVDPHPFFSRRYYLAANPDVATAGIDAFRHFFRYGWRERRSIHPFFRTNDHIRFEIPNSGSRSHFFARLLAALSNPLLALQQTMFDATHYMRSSGTAGNIETPIQHFVTRFRDTRGSGFPLFDTEYFLSQAPDIRTGLNPYVEYLGDFLHSADPNRYFDRNFYMRSTHIDRHFKGSLLEHFVTFGGENGAWPHPRVVPTGSRPGEGSGWSVIQSFVAASGRQLWLCDPDYESLVPHLAEMNSLEPAISPDLLKSSVLHGHSGPVDGFGRLFIATVTKIARCNCLVVSDAPIGDDLIAALHSPFLGMGSSTRPWLTLLACSKPNLRYSHASEGATIVAGIDITGDLEDRVRFVADAIVTALPHRLVMMTDPLGVELLRRHGSQLLTAIPEVVLIADQTHLEPASQHWLNEYLLTNCHEFAKVAIRGDPASSYPALGLLPRSNASQLVRIQEA
jgi:transposase